MENYISHYLAQIKKFKVFFSNVSDWPRIAIFPTTVIGRNCNFAVIFLALCNNFFYTILAFVFLQKDYYSVRDSNWSFLFLFLIQDFDPFQEQIEAFLSFLQKYFYTFHESLFEAFFFVFLVTRSWHSYI